MVRKGELSARPRELRDREHGALEEKSMGMARKALQFVRERLESYSEIPPDGGPRA